MIYAAIIYYLENNTGHSNERKRKNRFFTAKKRDGRQGPVAIIVFTA